MAKISLEDAAKGTKPKSAPGNKGGADTGNTIKVILALLVILGSLGYLGYATGIFDSGPPKQLEPVSPEVEEEWNQIQQEQESPEMRRTTPSGG